MKRVSTVFTTNTSDLEFPFACHGFVQINLAGQSQEPKSNPFKNPNWIHKCRWLSAAQSIIFFLSLLIPPAPCSVDDDQQASQSVVSVLSCMPPTPPQLVRLNAAQNFHCTTHVCHEQQHSRFCVWSYQCCFGCRHMHVHVAFGLASCRQKSQSLHTFFDAFVLTDFLFPQHGCATNSECSNQSEVLLASSTLSQAHFLIIQNYSFFCLLRTFKCWAIHKEIILTLKQSIINNDHH